MGFLEKEATVKELKVKLKAVNRKTMRNLNAIITPSEFKQSEADDLKIKLDSWENYKDQMIIATVVEPKFTVDSLGELEPQVFDELFSLCQEVNGLKKTVTEADEKK
jgi:hypothetical protein